MSRHQDDTAPFVPNFTQDTRPCDYAEKCYRYDCKYQHPTGHWLSEIHAFQQRLAFKLNEHEVKTLIGICKTATKDQRIITTT